MFVSVVAGEETSAAGGMWKAPAAKALFCQIPPKPHLHEPDPMAPQAGSGMQALTPALRHLSM